MADAHGRHCTLGFSCKGACLPDRRILPSDLLETGLNESNLFEFGSNHS